jgi:hypothetical protein
MPHILIMLLRLCFERKRTMPASRLHFWAISLLTAMFANTASAFDKADVQRFLNEYPAAAESFVKKLAMSAGTIESMPVGRFAKDGTRTYKFRMDHGCEKIDSIAEVTLNGKPRSISSAYVYCEDDKSFFELTKRPDGDGYLVRSLGSSPKDFAYYRASIGSLMTVPLGSAKSLLLRSVKADVMVIEEVAPEPSNPKFVRVRFSMTPKFEGAMKHTYTFVLDPENHWAVISEERAIGGKFPSVHKMEVEYGPKVDGFAMPAKVKFSREGAVESEYRYTDWKFVPTGRDEFRPSHYDLPDLPLAKNGGNPKYMYLLIALIVSLLILGGYLLKVSKRSTKTA